MDAKHPLAAVLAIIACLVVAGCGGDDEENGAANDVAPVGVFVGTVEGTEAYIGIKSDGEMAGGYLCNGQKGVSGNEVVSVWLDESALAGSEAELVTRDGEAIGTVTVSAEGTSGEVEIDGETHAFTVAPASRGAGIAREVEGAPGEPGYAETGWIVLADGSVRGARHTGGVNIADGTSNTFKPTSSKPSAASFIDPTTDL